MSGPDTPPRLLYLMNEALFFTTHRMPVARRARELGFEIHVAAPREQPYVAIIEAEGFQFHDIPLVRGGRSIAGEFRLLARCWRLLKRIRPDLVHHVAMKPIVFGGLASRLLRVPAVVHAVTGLGFLFIREDLASRLLRAVILRLYRFALHHRNGRAIFQNPDDLAMFRRRGLVERGTTVLIPGCGVDMAVFQPPGERAPKARPLVMFPARLLGDKGLNEFIEAARRLRAEGIAADFCLLGRRDPINPTDVGAEALAAWQAEGLVEWWGFSDDMPRDLPKADIVCMPSYREGLPRGLIEAAACGLPIVTTDVPGCRDVVRDGVNGLLVPVRDAAATAAALKRLIEDPLLRATMGRNGRARALAQYRVEDFVAATIATYRAVRPDLLPPAADRAA